MTTTILDDDRDERIARSRRQLLTELTTAAQALCEAADTLSRLRGPHLYDIELIDGRDGRDIATFLDDGSRYVRAAVAVVHAILDKEAP